MVSTVTRPKLEVAMGSFLGLLSVGMGIGVGELVAAVLRPEASPTIAVGNRFILLTPEWLKHAAINLFGTNDKHALLTGIYLFVAVFGAAVGVLALRQLRLAYWAIGFFGLLGAYCALTTNAHQTSDALPSLVSAGVAAIVLTQVLQRWQLREEAQTRFDTAKPGSHASKIAFAQAGMQRRKFLMIASLTTAGAAVAGFGGRAWQHLRFDAEAARATITLPPVAAPVSGIPDGADLGKGGVPFVIANSDFYRIDTALVVPQLDPKTWRLKIHGMVKTPMTLTYEQLIARPMVERYITMACVSNEVGGDLIGTAKFQGVLLADILREVGVDAGADQLVSSSSDGMTIGTPTAVAMDGRDAMLAIAMNGEPLPIQHGFPVRMVIPGLYGYVSACKWIVDIEATTFDKVDPYWVARGWVPKAPVVLESRIESPKPNVVKHIGETISIAGTAWQTHVGVSKVEVKVDNDEWTTATLATVPSIDTWVQWVVPYQVTKAGVHRVTVRATNAKGELQTTDSADPYPSGATGLHTITFRAS
jgi:DMSO/TMAO reductase YedYZ molybdopterin-dependent catalytic subunit